MNKSLYYIECTCIKDCKYPNVEFHAGETLYYNGKASSNEMYLFNHSLDPNSPIMNDDNRKKYWGYGGNSAYLPFTRKKQNAKKWEIRRYAETTKNCIEHQGEFKCEIKEIKVTYTEEELN